jgi:hypothetical protein
MVGLYKNGKTENTIIFLSQAIEYYGLPKKQTKRNRRYVMEEKYENHIFLCSCGSEGLSVYGIKWEDCPIEIEIAFWKYGHDVPYTLKEKLRAIKYIFKKGHPYEDMVILNEKTAREFAEAVLEACDNPKMEE